MTKIALHAALALIMLSMPAQASPIHAETRQECLDRCEADENFSTAACEVIEELEARLACLTQALDEGSACMRQCPAAPEPLPPEWIPPQP